MPNSAAALYVLRPCNDASKSFLVLPSRYRLLLPISGMWMHLSFPDVKLSRYVTAAGQGHSIFDGCNAEARDYVWADQLLGFT